VGVEVFGHVVALGGAAVAPADYRELLDVPRVDEARAARAVSPLYCLDPATSERMVDRIRAAAQDGDTLGGVVEVVAVGLPPGFGSHRQLDQRLDAQLGAAMLSIPAIKGMEVGAGFWAAGQAGSQVHDPIVPQDDAPGRPGWGGFSRPSNRAGGLEGGITNGQPLVVRAAMKPISTLRRPLVSVDLRSRAKAPAGYERSDVCAVPAAAIVAEAMVRMVLTNCVLEQLPADTMETLVAAHHAHLERCRKV
jgi:chorismate synthase